MDGYLVPLHYNDAKASGILRKEVYYMTDDGVAVNRINPDLCAAHLEAWKEISQIKCKETGTDPATLHQWDTGTADAISIFDGPSGMFNMGAQASGLHPMPAIDEVAEVPYDLLNDAHYASVMVGIYTQQPGFGLVAPPCGWWTAAMRFNRRRSGVMKRMKEGREIQLSLIHI